MSEPESVEPNSHNNRHTDGSDRRSGSVRVAVSAALAPPVMFFAIAFASFAMTNSLDPAFQLGISDNLFIAILVGFSGLLAGIVVGLVAGMSGKKLVVPPLVGLFVGVAIYLAFVAFEAGEYVELDRSRQVIIWIGLSASLFLATRLSGYTLVGAAAAAAVIGVGAGAVVRALPEPVAEVVLILADYTADPTTGECSGSGELSEVVEGSHVFLIDTSEAVVGSTGIEKGSIVLPAGMEIAGGCRFELGDPLGQPPAEYFEILFLPESDPNVGVSANLEGHRVIITMGAD